MNLFWLSIIKKDEYRRLCAIESKYKILTDRHARGRFVKKEK